MQVFAEIMAALMASLLLSSATVAGAIFAACSASTGACVFWVRRRRRLKGRRGATPPAE